jgi:hypothetical protein
MIMDKIIREIYYGNLSNTCIKMPKSKEYRKIEKKEYELYDKLKAVIPEEFQSLFDEFVEVFGDKHDLIAQNFYVRGFKIGLRLGVETYDFTDIDENAEK